MFYPRNFDQIYDYINDPNVLTVNWADCVIQITHVNRNNNFMSIDQVIFQKLLSGEIEKKYLFQTTADHYDSALDYFRLFLELILFLMIWYRVLNFFKHVYKFFDIKSHYEEADPEIKESPLIYRVFFLSHKAVIEGQCCYVIVMIIGRVILTILLWVICSLKALYNFVTSSIFYTVRTISVVLIILTILYWIQIGTASTFHVEADGTTDENTFNIINSKVNLIIINKWFEYAPGTYPINIRIINILTIFLGDTHSAKK